MLPTHDRPVDVPFAASSAGQLARRAGLPQPSAVVLALGLLILAAAIVWHGRTQRYDVRPLAGTLFVRVDRQTGALVLCAHPVGTALDAVSCVPVRADEAAP